MNTLCHICNSAKHLRGYIPHGGCNSDKALCDTCFKRLWHDNELCPLCRTVNVARAVKVSKKTLKAMFMPYLRDVISQVFYTKTSKYPQIENGKIFLESLDPNTPSLELAFESKTKKVYSHVLKLIDLYTPEELTKLPKRLAGELSPKRLRDVWLAHSNIPEHAAKAQATSLVIKLFSISPTAMSRILIHQYAFDMLQDFDTFAAAHMN